MRTVIPMVVLLIIVACAPSPPAIPQTMTSPSPSPSPWENVTLIGDILANPAAYTGREVTVIAYYRGWDLLREVTGGPPLTRSDIAVADATGGIYIAFAGAEAIEGLPPLLPFQLASTETLLRLRGKVEIAPSGQPYIRVTKGEQMEGLPAHVLLRARRTGGIVGMDQELLALADGTLYFLDRKIRAHARWKIDPVQVVQAVENIRPFLDREVGTPTPDNFIYKITVLDGEKARTAIFHEAKLSEDAARALDPVRTWFRETMNRAVRPTPTPGQFPGPVMAAVRALAEQQDIPPEQVTVVAWEPVDWPDTSLGCPEPGKVYAQVITPGYRVFLEARGKTYTIHTDRAGRRVVFCFPK